MKLKDLYNLSDRDLIAELRLCNDGLTGNEAIYDLLAADTTAFGLLIDSYEGSTDTLDTKRVEASAARGDRDNARKATVNKAKAMLKKARLKVGNDPGKLGNINLDAYDDTATSPDAPGSAPFALIDLGILRHTINFRDSSTPDKRGKPAGMLGAEIWSKVGGDAPANESDYTMVALDTSSPHIVNYSMEDAGKKAWYRLRWVTTSMEKGGWGETAEATING